MSREVCYICRRAKVACLCGRIEKHSNQIKIIVLQHPDEVSNAKGSAIIAKLGLKQYQSWVGEDFSQHPAFNELMDGSTEKIRVLYPDLPGPDGSGESRESRESSESGESGDSGQQTQQLRMDNTQQVEALLVIDATWRKARLMWECNPRLQWLGRVMLGSDKASNYRIRKVPKQGYLSTVEAIVGGLRVLERQSNAYQSLLVLFDEMIDFQINSMGVEVYNANYERDE